MLANNSLSDFFVTFLRPAHDSRLGGAYCFRDGMSVAGSAYLFVDFAIVDVGNHISVFEGLSHLLPCLFGQRLEVFFRLICRLLPFFIAFSNVFVDDVD